MIAGGEAAWILRAGAYAALQAPGWVLLIEPLHGVTFACAADRRVRGRGGGAGGVRVVRALWRRLSDPTEAIRSWSLLCQSLPFLYGLLGRGSARAAAQQAPRKTPLRHCSPNAPETS